MTAKLMRTSNKAPFTLYRIHHISDYFLYQIGLPSPLYRMNPICSVSVVCLIMCGATQDNSSSKVDGDMRKQTKKSSWSNNLNSFTNKWNSPFKWRSWKIFLTHIFFLYFSSFLLNLLRSRNNNTSFIFICERTAAILSRLSHTPSLIFRQAVSIRTKNHMVLRADRSQFSAQWKTTFKPVFH